MIQTHSFSYADGRIAADVALFAPSFGVKELHACFRVRQGLPFERSWLLLQEAVGRLAATAPGGPYETVWQRVFLSDGANQLPFVADDGGAGARSFIGQCPLDGGKVALWVYAVVTDAPAKAGEGIGRKPGETRWNHNGRTHVWSANYERAEGTSGQQTHALLERYMEDLRQHRATLPENCIRTWFYVRDIDLYYEGLVKARKALFEANGLTPETHYIASTGIQGKGMEAHALVHLDAYAVVGLQPGQVTYLRAPSHLNPTHEYGVTFERGTAVAYGDRTHLFISGTASINNRGEIMYPYRVEEQTLRMWENVEALLAEREAGGRHIMQATVYLRDASDYPAVKGILEDKMPAVPLLFVQAPVCRPGWLVEMECMAVLPDGDAALAPY